MDPKQIMDRFHFLRSASPQFLDQIGKIALPANLKAGTYFFHEGDICKVVGTVGSGDIRVYKTGSTGRQITLYHLCAGEMCLLNILSVILDQPAAASAQAETAVEALMIPADEFRQFIRSEDSMRNYVFKSIAARIDNVMTLVEDVAFQKMDTRVGEYLYRSLVTNRSANGVISITHEQIAAELGSAREVISRILKE